MEKNHTIEQLIESSAFSNGHFVLESGRHSDTYVDKASLYVDTNVISHLCAVMAYGYADEVDRMIYEITPLADNWPFFMAEVVVVGPALGGIVLSQWFAHHLKTHWPARTIKSIFAEKSDDGFVFNRGYGKHVAHDMPVIIVEDVMTTGGSVCKVVDLVRRTGGNVIGVCSLVNRGGVTSIDVGDVPVFRSLLDVSISSSAPEECLLCKENVPVNIDLGKGARFLAEQAERNRK